MKTQSNIKRLVSASVAFLAAQVAMAQGVGNLGSLPTQFSSPVPITGWSVDSGNAANPWLPVQIDPNGPQWVKTFSAPNGQPFTAFPGQTFTLQELLVVAPPNPWTDWHEHILTPGWEWVQPTVFLANFAPPSNFNSVYTPGSGTTGGTVDFYFDPLAPGTLIDIRKTLQYVGASGAVFNGTLQIAQYPTPEPASLLLLAVGGMVALRRNRG